MTFSFGTYNEPFLSVPYEMTLHKIVTRKYGFNNNDLDRRAKYLINHPQRLKHQEISTRLRQLNKMFDLELEAATKQQVVRERDLDDRKVQAKLKKFEVLAKDYRTKKLEHVREKEKENRLKRQVVDLKQKCVQVKDENLIRQIVQRRLDRSSQVVKKLQGVKKQADVAVYAMTQRLNVQKRDFSSAVEKSRTQNQLIKKECKQLAESEKILARLKQFNACLKVYNAKLDAYAKVILQPRCRDLKDKIEDMKYITSQTRKLDTLGEVKLF